MLFGDTGGGNEAKPTLPIITVSDLTETSATIHAKSTDTSGIANYEIKVGGKTYTSKDGLQDISGLKAATTYTVEAVAINNAGIRSDSASTTFSTAADTVTPENTQLKDKEYWTGDRVYYNGKEYEAKWWTKGDQPDLSGAYGPWKEI